MYLALQVRIYTYYRSDIQPVTHQEFFSNDDADLTRTHHPASTIEG